MNNKENSFMNPLSKDKSLDVMLKLNLAMDLIFKDLKQLQHITQMMKLSLLIAQLLALPSGGLEI